ncbi:hypothetical protein L1049_008987 [Liquidambar formosana]|uniref:DEX1 C-terminal domain-containing protein n=1 Tax=Liquidambar formosana TaxID=63359 RepID=A0AAP0SBJ6_LIQFO
MAMSFAFQLLLHIIHSRHGDHKIRDVTMLQPDMTVKGFTVSHSSRAFRDEEGKNFWVEIEIIDKYRYPSGSQAPYNVTTTLLVPGNYQGERRIKQSQIFRSPWKTSNEASNSGGEDYRDGLGGDG